MRQKLIKLLIGAIVAYLLLSWANSLKRDLNLTSSGKSETSNWELGGVNTIRNLGEDVWDLNAETVIRVPPLEKFFKSVSKINGPSGLRTVNSPKGEYDAENKTLLLYDADGIWMREEHPLDWTSPEAHWQTEGDIWTFPRGVTVISDIYRFDAGQAVMKAQHEIHAVNGCIRWWNE